MKNSDKLNIEIHLLCYPLSTTIREQIKPFLYSVFQTDTPLRESYSIVSYQNKVNDGITNLTNLIEVHTNQKQHYNSESKTFKLVEDEFYTKYSPYDDYEDLCKFSQCFMKYSTQNKTISKIGSTSVIEYCRCEKNIGDVLSNIGYQVKNKFIKNFDLFRMKNTNIYLQTTTILTEDDKQKIKYDIYELFGFCVSNEEEQLVSKMMKVKEDLSTLFQFY